MKNSVVSCVANKKQGGGAVGRRQSGEETNLHTGM